MSELHKELFETDIRYTLHGDYYMPDFEVDPIHPLGKYGIARMEYLREQRPDLYILLLLSSKLYGNLHQADLQAQYMLDTMIPQMAKRLV